MRGASGKRLSRLRRARMHAASAASTHSPSSTALCNATPLARPFRAHAGAQLGRPSDVWSLGCILFAMVYGKTPFEHVKNLIARLRAISDPAFNIEFKPIPNPYLLDVLKVHARSCGHCPRHFAASA